MAKTLAISPATLRQWSNEFSDFLSESARQTLTEAGTHAQRRYTEADIQVLQRAKSLLAGDLTYSEVRAKLAEPPAETGDSDTVSEPSAPAEPPDSETASAPLAIIEQYRLSIASMQQTIEAQAAHVETLKEALDRAEARAAKSEQDATELRRALLDQLQRPAPERQPRPWWKFWERNE